MNTYYVGIQSTAHYLDRNAVESILHDNDVYDYVIETEGDWMECYPVDWMVSIRTTKATFDKVCSELRESDFTVIIPW